ncbi:hypothetical protein [uncultured Gimesia sp.]|uniref:hypothetical protein n=1 Tax=uncultured Gimesia sp. TaxID=1678688 RepID=UPI00260F4B8A|nr:hypothetical protein [uncultured Gimesia sp.]
MAKAGQESFSGFPFLVIKAELIASLTIKTKVNAPEFLPASVNQSSVVSQVTDLCNGLSGRHTLSLFLSVPGLRSRWGTCSFQFLDYRYIWTYH